MRKIRTPFICERYIRSYNEHKLDSLTPLIEKNQEKTREDVITDTVCYALCNCEDNPLPLPPPLLLFLQSSRGVGEEHDVFLALDLALQKLHCGTVEAHHVLNQVKKKTD